MSKLSLFLALVACTCVRAQDTLSVSLSDAIQRGLERNFQIRIAESQLAVAENNDDYALTQKYPHDHGRSEPRRGLPQPE